MIAISFLYINSIDESRLCEWQVSLYITPYVVNYDITYLYTFPFCRLEKIISITLSFTVIGINLYFIVANLEQVNLTPLMIFGVGKLINA